MDNLKLWALILGVVAVLVSGLVLFGSFSLGSAPPPARLELPTAVPGFVLKETLPRVDPLFDGESFSSHASFAPAADSPFAATASRVGVALYHFQTAAAVMPALKVLSLGNELSSRGFHGQTVMERSDPAAGQVTLFWVHGADLVQVLAVGQPGEDGFDLETLEAAGLALLDAAISSATP